MTADSALYLMPLETMTTNVPYPEIQHQPGDGNENREPAWDGPPPHEPGETLVFESFSEFMNYASNCNTLGADGHLKLALDVHGQYIVFTMDPTSSVGIWLIKRSFLTI